MTVTTTVYASGKISNSYLNVRSVIVLDESGIDKTLLGWGLFYPGSEISISELHRIVGVILYTGSNNSLPENSLNYQDTETQSYGIV